MKKMLVWAPPVIFAIAAAAVPDLRTGNPWSFRLDILRDVLLLAAFLYIGVLFVIRGLSDPPSAPKKCRTCGYDIRASKTRCPECGAAVPWARLYADEPTEDDKADNGRTDQS